MIIHNCIKCDYNEFIPICENPPKIQRYFCPECGEEQFIYHSRINPRTYSKDSVKIDEKTKTIKILEIEQPQEIKTKKLDGQDFESFKENLEKSIAETMGIPLKFLKESSKTFRRLGDE